MEKNVESIFAVVVISFYVCVRRRLWEDVVCVVGGVGWQWLVVAAPGQRHGGQQDGCGEKCHVAPRTDRPGKRLGGRLHATVKPTVVELGDGAILRSPALQIAILGFELPHRVGLDVPANTPHFGRMSFLRTTMIIIDATRHEYFNDRYNVIIYIIVSIVAHICPYRWRHYYTLRSHGRR